MSNFIVLLTRRGATARLLPAALIGASFAPMLWLQMQRLTWDDRYRHFPLLMIASVVLMGSRLRMSDLVWPVERSGYSIPLLVLGYLLLIASIVLVSPGMASVAAIVAMAGLLFDTCGRNAWSLIPAWLLLWLTVPLPLDADDALMFRLQGLASRSASLMLDFTRFNHLLAGHVIEVPGHKFLVEEACSGIRSLQSMVALAAIFVVYERRTLIHSLLLLASCLPWAVIVNVLRILLVIIVQIQTGVDLATGWRHESLGIVVFGLGLWMLFCTDRILLFLLEGVGRSAGPRTAATVLQMLHEVFQGKPGVFGSWLVAGLFVITAGIPSAWIAIGRSIPASPTAFQGDIEPFLRKEMLPPQFRSWRLTSFDRTRRNTLGIGFFSGEWKYESEQGVANVSLDYPFSAWHHLTDCYRAAGWESRSLLARKHEATPSMSGFSFVEVALHRPPAQNVQLLFLMVDANGRTLVPPQAEQYSVRDWRTTLRLRLLKKPQLLGYRTPCFQLQVLLQTKAEASELQRAEAEALLAEAWRLISGRIAGDGPSQ